VKQRRLLVNFFCIIKLTTAHLSQGT